MRRGIIKDDSCLFCLGSTETAIHVLWEYCPSAMDGWGVSGKCFQKSCGGGDSFRIIFESLLNRCKSEEVDLFAVVAKRYGHVETMCCMGGAHTSQSTCQRGGGVFTAIPASTGGHKWRT